MTGLRVPTDRETAYMIAHASEEVDRANAVGRDLRDLMTVGRNALTTSVLAGSDLRAVRNRGIHVALIRDALPTWRENAARHP